MLGTGKVGAKSFVLRNRAPRAKGASGATAYSRRKVEPRVGGRRETNRAVRNGSEGTSANPPQENHSSAALGVPRRLEGGEEYWLESDDPSAIVLVEAQSMHALTLCTMAWEDLMDVELFPAITARQGLEALRQKSGALGPNDVR